MEDDSEAIEVLTGRLVDRGRDDVEVDCSDVVGISVVEGTTDVSGKVGSSDGSVPAVCAGMGIDWLVVVIISVVVVAGSVVEVVGDEDVVGISSEVGTGSLEVVVRATLEEVVVTLAP